MMGESEERASVEAEAERRFADGVRRLMEAGHVVHLDMDPSFAASLLGLIQLAWRHPGLEGTAIREQAERIGRAVQGHLASLDPELGRIMERGWRPELDVPFDDKREGAGYPRLRRPGRNRPRRPGRG